MARKKAPAQVSSGLVSSGLGTQGQGITLENAGQVLQNPAAFEEANRVLGPGGQHIESLGSDALQRWMQDNGVEEKEGGYWQRRQLPTGEMALVQVQPPNEVLEAEELGNSEMFSMMFRCALPNSVECMKSTLKLSIYSLCMKPTINKLNDA